MRARISRARGSCKAVSAWLQSSECKLGGRK
jgi:hypothetical protein